MTSLSRLELELAEDYPNPEPLRIVASIAVAGSIAWRNPRLSDTAGQLDRHTAIVPDDVVERLLAFARTRLTAPRYCHSFAKSVAATVLPAHNPGSLGDPGYAQAERIIQTGALVGPDRLLAGEHGVIGNRGDPADLRSRTLTAPDHSLVGLGGNHSIQIDGADSTSYGQYGNLCVGETAATVSYYREQPMNRNASAGYGLYVARSSAAHAT